MTDANAGDERVAADRPSGDGAGRPAPAWFASRPVVVVGSMLVVMALVWGLKSVQPDPKKPPEPPPVARVPVKIAPDPAPAPNPPVPFAAAGPRLAPAVPMPEEDAGLKAQVMAIQTQAPARQPTPSAAPARPASAAGVGSTMMGTDIVQVAAINLGPGTYRLGAGSYIPCLLDSAMDTTVAGFVRCHLDRDIYSDTGAVVLLEAGTIVIGEYMTSMRQGQERIGVIWSQARTPNGVTIRLNSPGTDPAGRMGMDGQIETYFWTRFGAALMFSLVQDAVAFGRAWALNQNMNGSGNAVNYSIMGANSQGAADQVIAETLRATGNIPPVLKKNQGERVTIFVRNDLDFSKVYRLDTSE